MAGREQKFLRALAQLTPVFQRQLPAKDIRHDLYGREQLTWNEYERIGESVPVQRTLATCTPGELASCGDSSRALACECR